MNPELYTFFEAQFGEKVVSESPLKAHGSDRKLYRLQSEHHTAIGVEHIDRAENIAFLEFSRHFRNQGLPVPQIYAQNLETGIYLEEDLGDDTLFDLLTHKWQREASFPGEIETLYEKVVRFLPAFQVKAGASLNYDVCTPRHSFDGQSMQWDLNYFKYYFLKLAEIPFDEQRLEDDFERLIGFLLRADGTYFLYRDFQSRNILVRESEPYFIDYQGGRRGPLQYDIASLLYDAKANLPFDLRERLLQRYLTALAEHLDLNQDDFLRYYSGYVLIRILQAMGAYGFRGFYQRKVHFLQSVPYALRNLEYLLTSEQLPDDLSHLREVLQRLVRSTRLRQFGEVHLPLTVHIRSFSYRNGLPEDRTGHGGGFIFDCRSLPNPGRQSEYEALTGNDQAVIDFLEEREEVQRFIANVRELISQVVENYSQRNFSHLSVDFGCTGGQHRSVYCANEVTKYLQDRYHLKVELTHRELERIQALKK